MSSLSSENLLEIFKFLNVAEKLKCEMRHSWLSSGRQESVAEHSWRMSLMVILFAPYLSQPVNLEKCLKMAILHDLAEAEVGDIPVFEAQEKEIKERKKVLEWEAMKNLCATLPPSLGNDLFSLWEEYEEKKCFEALFVNALDKIEVHLQHVEAPLSTWIEIERDMLFQDKWMKAHCQFDPALLETAEKILQLGIEKLAAAGEDIESIARRATS
jgi:putative hydrolases of HD superfamily